MMHWINGHGIETAIMIWVYCALVSPMPKPSPKSSPYYDYFYTVSHAIMMFAAGNLDKVPGIGPMVKQFVTPQPDEIKPESKDSIGE